MGSDKIILFTMKHHVIVLLVVYFTFNTAQAAHYPKGCSFSQDDGCTQCNVNHPSNKYAIFECGFRRTCGDIVAGKTMAGEPGCTRGCYCQDGWAYSEKYKSCVPGNICCPGLQTLNPSGTGCDCEPNKPWKSLVHGRCENFVDFFFGTFVAISFLICVGLAVFFLKRYVLCPKN